MHTLYVDVCLCMCLCAHVCLHMWTCAHMDMYITDLVAWQILITFYLKVDSVSGEHLMQSRCRIFSLDKFSLTCIEYLLISF